MGLIGRILGIGEATQGVGGAVESVAEVFTVNKTKAELAHRQQAMASLEQYGAEFVNVNQTWFDIFINGINRLPRPVLAIGTIGLFIFAMANPEGFAGRMQGLAYIPDPLWWLLGAVVSFYFGARELHYGRARAGSIVMSPLTQETALSNKNIILPDSVDVLDNPALSEWLTQKAA